jgi:hypothetical protein
LFEQSTKRVQIFTVSPMFNYTIRVVIP